MESTATVGDGARLRADARIRLEPSRTRTPTELRAMLQRAVQIEMATLPPYLYAFFSTGDANQPAIDRLHHIWHEEMVHMVLACNILNAIGGRPRIADAAVVPMYPHKLPFSLDDDLPVSLIPFSKAAMEQGMGIERPEDPLVFMATADAPDFHTIGQFYDSLKEPLRTLPLPWGKGPDRQLGDGQFFPGEIFPVRNADDAVRAIDHIVSEGEGAKDTPLDFGGELSHYYRFQEMALNKVLQRAPDQPHGFAWGPSLGIDFSQAVAAITDPATHDLSGFPEVQAAQDRCDRAFTSMLREIQRAVNGEPGRLGNAVGDMLTLRREAIRAFAIPFGTPALSAGPAFRFRPDLLA